MSALAIGCGKRDGVTGFTKDDPRDGDFSGVEVAAGQGHQDVHEQFCRAWCWLLSVAGVT